MVRIKRFSKFFALIVISLICIVPAWAGNGLIFGTSLEDSYLTIGGGAFNADGLNLGHAGASYGAGGSFFNAHSANGISGRLYIGTDSVTRVTITSTGLVGIGTTAPIARLSVMNSLGNVVTQIGGQGGVPAGLRALSLGYGDNYNGVSMGEAGYIQAEWQGNSYRPLLLNPLGGSTFFAGNGAAGSGTIVVNGNVNTNGALVVDGGGGQGVVINSNQIWKSPLTADPTLYLQYSAEGGPVQIGDGAGAANPLYVYGEIYTRDQIRFSDNSIISKAPRTYRTYDPRAGCPAIHPAWTAFWPHQIVMARPGVVMVTGQIIRFGSGRHDLYLYKDLVVYAQTITNTGPTVDWIGGTVSSMITLPAGTHTFYMASETANSWGCGGWGYIDTMIIEE